MTGARHQKISVSLGVLIFFLIYNRIDLVIISCIGTWFGSIIPDLDTGKSKASMAVKNNKWRVLSILIGSIILSILLHLGYIPNIKLLFLIIFVISAIISLVIYGKTKKLSYDLIALSSVGLLVSLLIQNGYVNDTDLKGLFIRLSIFLITITIISIAFMRASHRGPTHSIFIPITGYIITYLNIDIFGVRQILFGFWLGYLLHILEDLLNSKPTKIFWPVSQTGVCFKLVKYNGKMESALELISIGLAIVSIFIYMGGI